MDSACVVRKLTVATDAVPIFPSPRACAYVFVFVLIQRAIFAVADETTQHQLDPAGWGSDHVGQPVPEYVTGDECLFCHRDIGPTWPENRHQLTIRPVDPESPAMKFFQGNPDTIRFAAQAEFLLGSDRHVRLLKRAPQYGTFELLSTAYSAADDGAGRLLDPAHAKWEHTAFAAKCAGCHTTGVDSTKITFSSISLDCFTCHGNVALEHTSNTTHALLSPDSRDARQVVSTCGQCHLRGGKSRSTQLPYPHNFVAGDNLFRDFQVDWSLDKLHEMNPGDKHIWENARDVAVFGRLDVTCLSCHDVHAQTTEKHQALDETAACNTCHVPDQAKSVMTSYQRITRFVAIKPDGFPIRVISRRALAHGFRREPDANACRLIWRAPFFYKS